MHCRCVYLHCGCICLRICRVRFLNFESRLLNIMHLILVLLLVRILRQVTVPASVRCFLRSANEHSAYTMAASAATFLCLSYEGSISCVVCSCYLLASTKGRRFSGLKQTLTAGKALAASGRGQCGGSDPKTETSVGTYHCDGNANAFYHTKRVATSAAVTTAKESWRSPYVRLRFRS